MGRSYSFVLKNLHFGLISRSRTACSTTSAKGNSIFAASQWRREPERTASLRLTANASRDEISPDPKRNEKDRRDIEVEQKFALRSTSIESVEETLRSLGFRPYGGGTGQDGRKCITDWYFDAPGPHWSLTRNDFWLRYRESRVDKGGLGKEGDVGVASSTGGVWELKVGRSGGRGQAGGGVTVYEEVQGEKAVGDALRDLAWLPEDASAAEGFGPSYAAFEVPSIPEGWRGCLIPFARIETSRSSWTIPEGRTEAADAAAKFAGLAVDLDGTDFGYMVGEVEAVVHDENKIDGARDRIKTLVSELAFGEADTGGDSVAVGKLEFFLMNESPDHYEACVKAGTMRSKT